MFLLVSLSYFLLLLLVVVVVFILILYIIVNNSNIVVVVVVVVVFVVQGCCFVFAPSSVLPRSKIDFLKKVQYRADGLLILLNFCSSKPVDYLRYFMV